MADKDFKVKNKLFVNGLNNASGVILATNNNLDSHTTLPTQYGGTGTTQSPTSGQVLYSASGSTYAPVSPSVIPGIYTIGTTAQRPTASAGVLHFNTDKKAFEVYTGTAWVSVAVNGAVPLAPTIGTVTLSALTASVPFTGPTDVGDSAITTYTATSNPGGITGSSASSPISVTGLSQSTSYTFTVTATNSYGVSNASSTSNSVTTAATPGAPTSVTVSDPGTDGYALVSWTAPASNGGSAITDYAVQYSSNSGSSWTTFSDGTSTSTSATVTGLTLNTAYIFRVAAINAIGTGSYSTASSSFTPELHDPNVMFPIAYTVTSSTASSITISGIPSTYSHLRIYTLFRSSRSAANDTVYMRFNGDSGNNYSYNGLFGQSTATTSGDNAQGQSMSLLYRCPGATYGSLRGPAKIDIYNYANTNIAKSFNSLGGTDLGPNTIGGYIDAYVGSWNSTSAINSITFLPGTGPTFNTDCVIMVYGIK